MMMRGGSTVNPLMMRAQRTTGADNSRPAATQKEVMTMETSTWRLKSNVRGGGGRKAMSL